MEQQMQAGAAAAITTSPLDAIPPEIKRHFFQDRQPPNLLTDYDAIGFDADHCIVKYNTRELVGFLVKIELQEFVDMGYPEEISHFDYDHDLEMCLNASVFDIDNGLVIKLAEGLEVVQAMKGLRKLSQDEIRKVYGNPPIFHQYQWPNTTHLAKGKGAYWVFITFFDTPKVAVALKAIELMEQGKLPGKSYFDIAMDMRTMVYNLYVHFNEKEVFPIREYGRYFREVANNPSKYIQYQPELRDSLKRLKDAGKKLFLGTNSHTEYSNVIMTATLGEDWRSFFDIVCCYCRKPLYFWDQKPAPFFTVDTTKRDLRGTMINDASQMKDTPGEIYTEGNAKILTHYFQRLLGISGELRVAFFGDQYITDVYASSTHPGWDGIAVVEEMAQYDSSHERGIDARHIKYEKYWGKDTYFVEHHEGKRPKRNYFISQLEDCARYMLPFVKNIDLWMGDSSSQDSKMQQD